ncbi:MAG: hypothetical protein K1X64_01390 [Myxococcaceae bacterium]|nr:hypothetical protein [Myxococcaceae bacterium]
MKTTRMWCLLGGALCACGPSGSGAVGGMGGEVCLPERKVCISVPALALEREVTLRITPTDNAPAGLIGEAWDIAPTGTIFLKPATVSFNYQDMPIPDGVATQLLRIYTRGPGAEGASDEWVPVNRPRINAVRAELEGDVAHLSPFFVLRADRLPDGGLPIQGNGGPVMPPPPPPPPPFDAGRPDAGRPDSGMSDAGIKDGGFDAGVPDAGPRDAGFDAGAHDAGFDAGAHDAGPFDAGAPDSGVGAADAGADDAGEPDAGDSDAGAEVDAGDPDAG